MDVDLKRPSDRYPGVFVFVLQVKRVHLCNCGKKSQVSEVLHFYLHSDRQALMISPKCRPEEVSNITENTCEGLYGF